MRPSKATAVFCFFFLFAFCFFYSEAQNNIQPYPIEISNNRTTNIIFPYAIKSADRGSRDIVLQKAKGIENVLQLKAASANFSPTNISVITADGKLYSFLASYAAAPKQLNISFASDSAILHAKHFLHYSASAEKIKISLKSIYIKEGLMWFTFQIKNKSLIGYEINFMHLFVEDKKKMARTALQSTELKFVYDGATSQAVAGHSTTTFAMAFAPFTIAKNKRLVIECSEAGGGRSLPLHISYKALLKARIIKQD